MPAAQVADDTLRDIAVRLVDNWTLADPNPETYRSILVRLAGTQGEAAGSRTMEEAAARIVCTALECGASGPAVHAAADRLIERGDFEALVDLVDYAPGAEAVAADIRQQILSSESLSRYLQSDAVSERVIARIVERSGTRVADQLLDALCRADSRATRRRLLSTIMMLGRSIATLVIERLDRGEWFVQRNMLAILGEMDPLPSGFSPLRYLDHTDPRVRREALRIAVRLPTERTAALKRAIADANPQVVTAALNAALADCPTGVVLDILRLAEDRGTPADTRELAVRAAGASRDPRAVRWLLERVRPPGWAFWRKLGSPPDLVPLIAARAATRSSDTRVQTVLAAAAASDDPALRSAATGPAS